MQLPEDYAQKVYAGVLGKIIGVYLGRPVEQWSHEAIMDRVGEIDYYVHDRLGKPLIVPDDDISGTFTFLRALPDHGNLLDITPQQIGWTWLNYVIENRTILWWGGMGASTEHTAFLRLKHGIMPPESGSARTNSRVVAEQIGSQIFIDGWGLVSPGDPEQAAELARRAACVSHDGEAIYGAQVVAALAALAFVQDDVHAMLDAAVEHIPGDCTIRRVIGDVREWAAQSDDWHRTRERIEEVYGYDTYGGGCHIVPNHALIIMSLVHAPDDFQQAIGICCTAGWDTDCNVANVGCIMGVKLGLEGIDAGADFRGPVADRLYLPCADGGRVISDAVREADAVVDIGRALAGAEHQAPKGGAPYHFSYPGSVQGFAPEDSPATRGVTMWVENTDTPEGRALAFHYLHLARGRAARVATPAFLPPDRLETGDGYGLMASPTLYPGQTLYASVLAGTESAGPVDCALCVRVYSGEDDDLLVLNSPAESVAPGEAATLEWTIPDTEGRPVAEVGLQATSEARADGVLYLERLGWSGAPDTVLRLPPDGSSAWQRAWVNAADRVQFGEHRSTYQLIQNEGRGMLIQGVREWTGYRATCEVTVHMADAAGLAACVQGQQRYYAVLLRRGGRVELVRVCEGRQEVLGSAEVGWEFDRPCDLAMEVGGGHIAARVNGRHQMQAQDGMLGSGAVALVCQEGRANYGPVHIKPLG